MNSEYRVRTSRECPEEILGKEYAYPSFNDGNAFDRKVTGLLPAMGWNSWNAFGSGNTEELTRIMADKFIELGLDKLGYKYIVLDDGCYRNERIDGKLSNEPSKFPNGFRSLADYIHSKGLKFGMYNDIGTNLCAGAAVGTCGYEDVDAASYAEWDIDFLKVDNCYYLWDNATFSNPENAKYVFTPFIKAIKIYINGKEVTLDAVSDGELKGCGGIKVPEGYVKNIGTLDGTGPENSPIGDVSSELWFEFVADEECETDISVIYSAGCDNGCGQWLQLAIGEPESEIRYFDGMLKENSEKNIFEESEKIRVKLNSGLNIIRIMNHRRQENVLNAYAAMFHALKDAAPSKNIILSMCEWGKNQPQNFGYKVGDSWRILNDITFAVGSDGNPGGAKWESDYTDSVLSQYNKAVIMDEFSGPELGYNDPDMLVIGMDGLSENMNRTHMTMWCMMNSPLMLGMDLRRVTKGDWMYNIIANEELIGINQDVLGIQAKRVFSTADAVTPDKTYITNNNRVDILVKPLAGNRVAISFINTGKEKYTEELNLDIESINERFRFLNAGKYEALNVWTKEKTVITNGCLSVCGLEAYDNYTVILSDA